MMLKVPAVPQILVLALCPFPAQAYVGPGAGLGAIAVTIAVLLGLVLLVVGFVWYPLKRMLRRRKAERDGPAASDN